ncbi:GerAB/ArcD/ProY family transporter [Paenibacillus sp. KS-LC4]|uniref:GerAB/ArcD/ProY family transporter n=1 Tax=Paenibacillus sp. KS-LC4 TaxID=2979727 RepID=UPI0030CE35C7
MNGQKVSPFQTAVLFYVFLTGATVIYIPGPLIGIAGTGAWISLLLSGAIGFLMLMMLFYLNRRFPDLDYIDYSRALIGNILTMLFGLAAISYILPLQASIVEGAGLFMVSAMMRETPIYLFSSLIFVIAACTARAGIEVIARMFVLLMLITTFFLFIVLVFALPEYQPEQLLPIAPKGLRPLAYGAYFTFGIPFAEVSMFGMLLPFVAGDKLKTKLHRSLSIALAASILTLCAMTICVLMVFGTTAAFNPFVLYSVARLIEFQEIIQRIESVIGMSLILGSYMKATISLYLLSLYMAKLFRLKDNNTLIMPLALCAFLLGLVTYDSNTQWNHFFMKFFPLWIGMVIVTPLVIVTAVAMLRPAKR